jgi:hypothetical protein
VFHDVTAVERRRADPGRPGERLYSPVAIDEQRRAVPPDRIDRGDAPGVPRNCHGGLT